MEMELGDMVVKVGLFILVQALVYLILSQSSNVFSKGPAARSHSFKPARSLSIRRWAAALADIPAGGEHSPSPKEFLRRPHSDLILTN
ncbi:transmembrane protein [Perilla frutescens var. hirtella]|nr:transmembrane protein [Perilla frutescens var. hirtella]